MGEGNERAQIQPEFSSQLPMAKASDPDFHCPVY